MHGVPVYDTEERIYHSSRYSEIRWYKLLLHLNEIFKEAYNNSQLMLDAFQAVLSSKKRN
jgi:hypothetical protein